MKHLNPFNEKLEDTGINIPKHADDDNEWYGIGMALWSFTLDIIKENLPNVKVGGASTPQYDHQKTEDDHTVFQYFLRKEGARQAGVKGQVYLKSNGSIVVDQSGVISPSFYRSNSTSHLSGGATIPTNEFDTGIDIPKLVKEEGEKFVREWRTQCTCTTTLNTLGKQTSYPNVDCPKHGKYFNK